MGLWPLAADGSVDFDTAGAIVTTHNGFGLTAAGKVAATTSTTVAYIHNGMAFDATGRLIIVQGGAVDHIHSGLALDASERVLAASAGPYLPHGGAQFDSAGRLFASGLAAPFVPSSLTGLVADYDPGLLTGLADADPITSCPDGSGNARAAAQATSSKQPTYRVSVFNGKPAMRFDGVDDYLLYDAGAAFYTGNTASFFIVHKPITVINNGRCLALWNGIANGDFNLPNVQPGAYGTTNQGDFRDGQLATVPQPSAGTPSVFSDVYDGTSQQAWKNGTAGTGPIGGSPATGAFAFREFIIGAGYSGGLSAYNNFDLARILIYNRALNTTERRQVEAYLGGLYGITVV